MQSIMIKKFLEHSNSSKVLLLLAVFEHLEPWMIWLVLSNMSLCQSLDQR
jgi:hypothetical protein